ncbi:chorismate mutase [Amycolatopsis orientalis]|uniref:chorismate mutase n=1 Tax=Amycolatopsis orientalis TaxID=31958 RepID=UPI00039E4164|nr:chorismate mutase [Amycolatopsis orientalis]
MFRGIAATALTVAGAMSLTVSPASAAAGAPPVGAPATHQPFGRLGTLTELVIERLRVSDDVAAAKFGSDSPIDDPAREQQVLDEVRRQAAALGLAPDAAAMFFRDQITASKIVQRGLFARWTAHPGEAPVARPGLGQIRTRLDRLTTDLLRQLKATMPVRTQPVPCAVQLTLAAGSAVVRKRLDPLHRQALGTAVHSVCPALGFSRS